MSEYKKDGAIINVKRVRRDVDFNKREKVVLTFGLNRDGGNDLDTLIATLQSYQGKQVNFDIRLDKKTSERGAAFDTAFVIVKEMIPKDMADASSTFTPKKSKQDDVRERAKKFEKGIE